MLWELFVYQWEYSSSESERMVTSTLVVAVELERSGPEIPKEKLRMTPRSLLGAPSWVMVVFIEIGSTSGKEDLFGVNGESRAWFGT